MKTPITAFHYSNKVHVRRHGPVGYKSYRTYKEWLRDEFHFRCVFCLVRELWLHEGASAFGVEHFEPKSAKPEWKCEYDNLAYCCNQCNRWKSTKRDFPDPCVLALDEHVYVDDGGIVVYTSQVGHRLVRYLRLNEEPLLGFRRRMIASLHDGENCSDYLKFPVDLPDLKALKPKSNLRPEGVDECYFERRANGSLPETL